MTLAYFIDPSRSFREICFARLWVRSLVVVAFLIALML